MKLLKDNCIQRNLKDMRRCVSFVEALGGVVEASLEKCFRVVRPVCGGV
jgi:hypothetical protein